MSCALLANNSHVGLIDSCLASTSSGEGSTLLFCDLVLLARCRSGN